jgi:hypothetical protein
MNLPPWPHGWQHRYEHTHSANREYSLALATDHIHPHSCCASHRFEVQSGDIGLADTAANRKDGIARERSEMVQFGADQVEGDDDWYAWSFYVPPDFPESVTRGTDAWPYITMTQFIQRPAADEQYLPALVFGKWYCGDFQLRLFPHLGKNGSKSWSLISNSEFRGSWHDLLLHVNWSESRDGSVHVWVNGESKVAETLATRTKGAGGIYHKYGLYRIADEHHGRAVAYFAQLRHGKSRADVDLALSSAPSKP